MVRKGRRTTHPILFMNIVKAQYSGTMTEGQVDLLSKNLMRLNDTVKETKVIPTFNSSKIATDNWLVGRVAQ